MSNGYAALGKARRGIIKRKKKTDIASGVMSTLGTVAAFAGSQAKKAATAWEEYEAGYKEFGGTEPIDKGGWFKRTFKGPGEGEVSIGTGKERRTYDRGQIQKAGAFLGSEASAILTPEMRQKYKESVAPGRADPLTGELKSSLTEMTGDISTGFGKGVVRLGAGGYTTGISDTVGGEGYRSGIGTDFGQSGGGITPPDLLQDYQPNLQTPGSTITAEDRYQTTRIQESQRMAPIFKRQRADQAAIGTTVELPPNFDYDPDREQKIQDEKILADHLKQYLPSSEEFQFKTTTPWQNMLFSKELLKKN